MSKPSISFADLPVVTSAVVVAGADVVTGAVVVISAENGSKVESRMSIGRDDRFLTPAIFW